MRGVGSRTVAACTVRARRDIGMSAPKAIVSSMDSAIIGQLLGHVSGVAGIRGLMGFGMSSSLIASKASILW